MTVASTKEVPLLPVPGPKADTALSRWLLKGGEGGKHDTEHTYPWYSVLWLTGVDYFSTLGYQPGIALVAAGALSPVATLLLLIVTLGGALPVYSQVAQRSYIGQGSIAMLEKLLPGWWGKLFVLILLGFASTDFVITMTLSASDAAEHLVSNPFLKPYLEHDAIFVTIVLLILLAVVFLLGFSEAIGLAVTVGIPYILLNVVVIITGFVQIFQQPELLSNWQIALLQQGQGNWTLILISAALTFPKLALGLSGFETGVSVMPLVKGAPDDKLRPSPVGRIKASKTLLLVAAVMMSILLITSSFATALLIPKEIYKDVSGHALSFLGHKLLGEVFGTVYDLSTIAILWFAGASAMAGMLNLVPRYLPRFGMAPNWVSYSRPLVLVLLSIDLIVTWIFKADVNAQGGAYATGVLVLILSASVAVSLALRKENNRMEYYFWGVCAIFVYTFIENVRERPDGAIIASFFILGIVIIGLISRLMRATELRVEQVIFEDDLSAELWPKVCNRKVSLVPLIGNDPIIRERKAAQIRQHYLCSAPFAFMHVSLRDDRSDFQGGLRIQIRQEGENFCIEVVGAVAIANAIAYISELIDPLSIFLGLTRKNMTEQSLNYILFGVGETGIMTYQILVRYWKWTEGDDVRPLIFLMSD